MSRDVCYRIEEVGGSIVLTQIWPDNRHYIKMSKSAANWVVNQIIDILRAEERSNKLLEKVFNCEVSRARKQAESIFGGKDGTKH